MVSKGFDMQIENEYKTVEKAFGEEGVKYVVWAAKMAVGLDTGVPWVMCKQDDAPDPVVSSIFIHSISLVRHIKKDKVPF